MIRLLLCILFSRTLSAQTVYKTPSGSKYHLANCRMVKNASSALHWEKALSDGLSACKICRPPYSPNRRIAETQKKTSGVKAMTRCFGITKKGRRCQHYTEIGNRYCFQHVPK